MGISLAALFISILSLILSILTLRLTITGTPEKVRISHRYVQCIVHNNKASQTGEPLYEPVLGVEFTIRNVWKQRIWVQNIFITIGNDKQEISSWARVQQEKYNYHSHQDKDRELLGHTPIFVPIRVDQLDEEKNIKIYVEVITGNNNSFNYKFTYKP